MLFYTKKCIVLDVITITKVKSRYYFCSLQKKGNNIQGLRNRGSRGQKKSTRFGYFGGFVLDFPMFIYW